MTGQRGKLRALAGKVIFNPAEVSFFWRHFAIQLKNQLLFSSRCKSHLPFAILGGTLALAVLAVDDHGHSSGKTKNCKVPFSQVLYQVWKSMAEDGVITLVRDSTPTETKRILNSKCQ